MRRESLVIFLILFFIISMGRLVFFCTWNVIFYFSKSCINLFCGKKLGVRCFVGTGS